ADFVTAINASEGKELSLSLRRAGQTVTVTVTPDKRSEHAGHRHGGPHGGPFGDVDMREVERAVREKLRRAGADMRMQFIEPGKIFPPNVRFEFDSKHEFPEDLLITVHKQGKAPAEIEVKQGDKSWKANADD